MADTRIEWASKVWNPVVGCSLASPGCTNCYAMRMAWRLQNMASRPDGAGNFHLDHYEGTVQQSNGGPVWTGKVNVAPDDVLLAPLRRKKPTDYFVNSMSDLFHPTVPFEVVDRVFAVMALTPQHTYKILTKRSERMREYLSNAAVHGCVAKAAMEIAPVGFDIRPAEIFFPPARFAVWPLRNVWLGVSAEDQRRADERIPDLLATPAAVRWISAEPLLGAIDLTMLDATVGERRATEPSGLILLDALTGVHRDAEDSIEGIYGNPDPHIDWVIAGGESGPGARPMHPDWARSLREQCADAGVPFLFKQWGDWRLADQSFIPFGGKRKGDFWCVGKKRAGRLLDGVEHNGMPEARHG